jgi:putative ABC transport system ATP-binding protein
MFLGVFMSAIQTSALSVQYESGGNTLEFPDLYIEPSEKVLLLGNSGSGKSTLLSLISGILSPSTGSVHIQNKDLFEMPHKQRDLFRGQNFGFVFQNLHLISSLTVAQNIQLTTDMLDMKYQKDKFEELIKSLGLQDKIHRKPSGLSHGEQQRVALARALIHSPKIVIADEPTSALDDKNTEYVMDLFERQCALTGAALVVATHDSRIKHRFNKVIHIGN